MTQYFFGTNIKKIVMMITMVFVLTTIFFGSFSFTYAQIGGSGSPNTQTGLGGGTNNPQGQNNNQNSNNAVTTEFDKLKNPLRSDIDSIPKIIQIILDIALVVGIPIVALGLIYSGFLFVKAQGNETKLTEAKQAFLYVIIGAFILLGAYVISEAIGATINALRA